MKIKIKICHICDRITGESDGVFTHLLMLFNSVDPTKYEQILIFQGGEVVKAKLLQLGIRYYIIPELSKRLSLLCIRKLYRVIIKENVDIIQAHLIKPYILSGLLNIFLKTKLIFNYHGLFLSSVYHNLIERLILQIIHLIIVYTKSVHLAITPSESSKRLLESETKIFPRVEVYYNGFIPVNQNVQNISVKEELLRLKSEYFIVGVVARMEIQKRMDNALKILQSLLNSGEKVFFVFFGEGPLLNDMRSLSAQLNVSDNCRFYGYVQNAPSNFDCFDIILFTSDWEGLPLTYWEAMANSIPIVSTDVGGAKEILVENNCGLVFPKGNIEAGKLSVQRLIDDKAFRLSLGKNGNRVLKQKYNMTLFKNYFEDLYENIIK
ncbi:MAG: glycosyltransferase [Melioribacteraceae bacterium]|nr:glycosyltransferase [Melioribacteraceae bacterium]